MSWLPYVVPAWILLVGLYGMTRSRHFVHMVLCLSVAQSATYVAILMIGYRTGATAPVFNDVLPGVRATDPIVQAVTLTDVVVGATVSALLLAFALRAYKTCGTANPQELHRMRG